MNNKRSVHCFQVLSLVFFFVLGIQDSVQGRLLSVSKKPHRNDAAAYARWLVSQNSWGVLKYEFLSLTLTVSFSLP